MEAKTADLSDQANLKNKLFDLLNLYAVERRGVTLASGHRSNIYLDCRQVYFRGEAQFIIGELFYCQAIVLERDAQSFSACGGMAMGSIPLSCALSIAAFRRGRELPGFCVRKQAKDHGMMSTIEGDKCLIKNTRALVVEDVITTASSAIKAITALRAHGLMIDNVLAMVDREEGGEKNLSDIGVKLNSLFSLSDFQRNSHVDSDG